MILFWAKRPGISIPRPRGICKCGGIFPFKKGKGKFYGGARGRFFSNPFFQREAKFPLAGRLFSWRAQGGFRISPLRALQTTRNPPETAAVGARRPRRGASPDKPARAANIIPPIGLTIPAFIRPDFSGGASCGGGREAPLSIPLEGVGVVWRGLGGTITEGSPWPLHKTCRPLWASFASL